MDIAQNEDARNLQWNPKEQYFASLGLHRRYDNPLLRYRADYFDERNRKPRPCRRY
ncbi:MAG: hypothetical protein U5L96_04960 [Owenweeksia sp.]|nr:hypothetical protein [Owenweeksia sp.]